MHTTLVPARAFRKNDEYRIDSRLLAHFFRTLSGVRPSWPESKRGRPLTALAG
jgi:hypothetical protein